MGVGGVHAYNAPLTIVGSTISNNTGIIAGVYFQSATHPLKIINSTISGNYGIDNSGVTVIAASSTEIINSTIYDNTAMWATAGVSGSNLALHNTIVANNDLLQVSDSDVHGSFNTASSHNLIGYDPNGLFPSGASNNNQIGTAAPLDPRLAPLDNYGGPTKTHALIVGSPAIDWGSNAQAVDQTGNPLTVDQRDFGFTRAIDFGGDGPTGRTVDVGAYEFNSALSPVAPREVHAAATGPTSIQVSWQSVSGATKYVVQRRKPDTETNFTTIASNVTAATYTDNTATSNTLHEYRVAAQNASGMSTQSQVGQATANKSNLTAYRPQSRQDSQAPTNGPIYAPWPKTPIAEQDENSNTLGAGIRMNADDDNQNGTRDRFESGLAIPQEDDLIELKVDRLIPSHQFCKS
jgi:hypothetical protein